MAKPDFTGTWKFNSGKSTLQIPRPDSTVFVIDHREPVFRFSRTHIVQGKTDTLELQLTTDGKEVVGGHGELRFRSRAYWDGETLVFESNITHNDEEGVNIVRYSLNDTGDLLLADEHLRSRTVNYNNRWVLDKQLQT